MRKPQPATYVKHLLSGCAEGNALLSSYDYSYNNPGPSPTIRKFNKPPLTYFKTKSICHQLNCIWNLALITQDGNVKE